MAQGKNSQEGGDLSGGFDGREPFLRFVNLPDVMRFQECGQLVPPEGSDGSDVVGIDDGLGEFPAGELRPVAVVDAEGVVRHPDEDVVGLAPGLAVEDEVSQDAMWGTCGE